MTLTAPPHLFTHPHGTLNENKRAYCDHAFIEQISPGRGEAMLRCRKCGAYRFVEKWGWGGKI